MQPVVAYFRMSTERQGRSGLGLDAQRERCAAFASHNGLEVVEALTEVQTGKGGDALDRRPQLAASLTAAKRRRCAVLVAKLDRLSRDVHFIAGLIVRRVAVYPHLTLTGLFDVLAAIRAARPLTPAERDGLDTGHVKVLRHLHDRLDAALAAAYGWPADLSAAAIVERVVALDRERVAEEAAGQVRWLRQAYQAPLEVVQTARKEQMAIVMEVDGVLPSWPTAVGAQYVALRAALARAGRAGPADLARQFRGVRPAKLAPMLEALAAMGQARKAGGGRCAA